MTRKLPYIPNKKLYAAVMGACSYIRATGYFNKAVHYYADKYNVSVDDVIRYVRIAQGNGQRMSTKKRKYYWFAVEYSYAGERLGRVNYFVKDWADYAVVKATSETNAIRRISRDDDYSELGHWTAVGRIKQFDTEEDAIGCCRKWKDENDH